MYIKHTVIEMDESMVQYFVICGEIISDYRNAMWPSGQPAPKGYSSGEIFVQKGNPTITTTFTPSEFANCY